MLEYLYTDACPSLGTISTENVLIVADQLLLSRLVQICEDHLHKSLQQVVPASSILDALAFSKVSFSLLLVCHTKHDLGERCHVSSLALVKTHFNAYDLIWKPIIVPVML